MTRADLIRWLVPLRLRQLRRAGVVVLAVRRVHRRPARIDRRRRMERTGENYTVEADRPTKED